MNYITTKKNKEARSCNMSWDGWWITRRKCGDFLLLIYFFVQKGGCQTLPPLEMDRYTHSVKFTYYSTLFSLSKKLFYKCERQTGNRFFRPKKVAVPWTCHASYIKEPDSVHHYYRKLYNNFSIKENPSCVLRRTHIYDYTQNHKRKKICGGVTFLSFFGPPSW